jgi:hypothetical protein
MREKHAGKLPPACIASINAGEPKTVNDKTVVNVLSATLPVAPYSKIEVRGNRFVVGTKTIAALLISTVWERLRLNAKVNIGCTANASAKYFPNTHMVKPENTIGPNRNREKIPVRVQARYVNFGHVRPHILNENLGCSNRVIKKLSLCGARR